MKRIYLITGGTGHLGRTIVGRLLEMGEHVRVLCIPQDKTRLPEGVECICGDVREISTLTPFFEAEPGCEIIVIHCAAVITILSKENPNVWRVNVEGTQNVLQMCFEHKVARMIYVSSVHAILPEQKGRIITEADAFFPEQIQGQYAKSKAMAANLVLDAAKRGLNVSIVHPSGIIGAGDAERNNHMTRTIEAVCKGRLLIGIAGGYDFVDVRDVAEGILACVKKGRAGECYILGGHYCTIRELMEQVCSVAKRRPPRIYLSNKAAKIFSAVAEKVVLLLGKRPVYTPYAIETLTEDVRYSHEKASKELDYKARPFQETIEHTVMEML